MAFFAFFWFLFVDRFCYLEALPEAKLQVSVGKLSRNVVQFLRGVFRPASHAVDDLHELLFLPVDAAVCADVSCSLKL